MLAVLRQITGLHGSSSQHWPALVVFSEAGVVDIPCMFIIARLRYFARLIAYAPTFLLTLIIANQGHHDSFAQLLCQDCIWLVNITDSKLEPDVSPLQFCFITLEHGVSLLLALFKGYAPVC